MNLTPGAGTGGADAPRCLLIAPLSFYSFHATLAEGLRQRGYEVDSLNEEYPANTLGKVMGKLSLPLLRRTTLRGLKQRLDPRPPYDLVLIIKGRGLGPAALTYLRTRARRIVGYNFDSFRFNPSPGDWWQLTDRYATFDIADAAERGLPLVHLFSAAPARSAQEPVYPLSIIQRVHSDRLALADLMLQATARPELADQGKPFVFLYEGNRLTMALGQLRRPRLYRQLRPHISLTPLPYARAMEEMGRSRVTFDYAHPLQSGITVRCFEAQSLGVAILTNNRLTVESGMFEPGSIAHLPEGATPEEVAALINRLWQSRPLPRVRTLGMFLDELLDAGETGAEFRPDPDRSNRLPDQRIAHSPHHGEAP